MVLCLFYFHVRGMALGELVRNNACPPLLTSLRGIALQRYQMWIHYVFLPYSFAFPHGKVQQHPTVPVQQHLSKMLPLATAIAAVIIITTASVD